MTRQLPPRFARLIAPQWSPLLRSGMTSRAHARDRGHGGRNGARSSGAG